MDILFGVWNEVTSQQIRNSWVKSNLIGTEPPVTANNTEDNSSMGNASTSATATATATSTSTVSLEPEKINQTNEEMRKCLQCLLILYKVTAANL